MNNAVVEILPFEPCETKVVIVPLFEQSIEIPADTPIKQHTLAQALYIYAAGKDDCLLGKLFTNRFWLCRSDARTKTAPALGNWARPAGTARGQLPGFAGALRPLQTHLPHTSHQLVPRHPQV